MEYCYLTDPGKVRDHNEDSVTIVKNINDEIKKSKIVLAKSLGAYILLIFEWVFVWVSFKNQLEIYNYFELFNIGMLGSLFLLDVTLVKEIINNIRNKYDYICSVTDEEIDDLIGILEQKQQDNHEKSL